MGLLSVNCSLRISIGMSFCTFAKILRRPFVHILACIPSPDLKSFLSLQWQGNLCGKKTINDFEFLASIGENLQRWKWSRLMMCLSSSSWKRQRQHGVWKSKKTVAFNIASEASYVYILSGLTKINQICQNWLPDWSILIGQNCLKMPKLKN